LAGGRRFGWRAAVWPVGIVLVVPRSCSPPSPPATGGKYSRPLDAVREILTAASHDKNGAINP